MGLSPVSAANAPGILVSRSYTHISTNTPGEVLTTTERAHSQGATWGDALNLRNIMVADQDSGDSIYTESHDGLRTSYTREYGSYDPLARTFTPSADSDIRTTATEGTSSSPDGITNRTTRSVSVANRFGRELYTAKEVYDGSAYHTIHWSANTHDGLGRVIRVDRSDGSWIETGYDCCGQSYVQTSDGSRTEFVYDDLKELDFTIEKGVPELGPDYPAQSDVFRERITDAFGREIASSTYAGGLSLTSSNTYDRLGRLITTTGPDGLTISNEYNTAARTHTVHNPDGGTATSVHYLDSQPKFTSGSAAYWNWTTYGVQANGITWTQNKRFGGGNLVNPIYRTKTTYTDFLGRPWRTEHQALDGSNGVVTVATESHYDVNGHLWKTSDNTPRADTLHEFDELGALTRSGLDLDGDGTLGANDRFSSSYEAYNFDGTNWHQTSWATTHTGALHNVTTSVRHVRLTGLSPALASESRSLDIHGNRTIVTTSFDTNGVSVSTVDSPYSTQDAVLASYNGLIVFSTSQTGHTTKFLYDALRRQIHTIDPRIGTNTIHYAANGWVDYMEDAAGHRTTYGYDAAGRRTSITDADSNTVHTTYSLKGEPLGQWGATYPVLHEYHPFSGDKTGLYTLRDTNAIIVTKQNLLDAKPLMDKTTLIFQPATGQLVAKRYADGYGPDFTWHSDGRLASRSGARTDTNGNRLVTSYGYTAGTRQIASRTYSEGTVSVSNSYNHITGQLLSTTDAFGTRSFSHNHKFQILDETHNGLLTNTLTRAYDQLARPAGHTLRDASGNPLQTISRGFDSLGRPDSITTVIHGLNPSSNRVDYGYLPDSDMIRSTTHDTGTAHIRHFEPHRNRINRIDNLHGTTPISLFDYTTDAAGRLTERIDESLGAVTTNVFGYNTRSELISALMGTNHSTYTFDPIGNRITANQLDGAFSYESNELNQFTNITSAGSTESPVYDPDGNMLDIDGFTATWDGHNRLSILSKSSGGTTTNLAFTYDANGRRIRKLVTVNGTVAKDVCFLYDAWNLILEHDRTGSGKTTTYTWGLDISNSEKGVGGVGGLLSVQGPSGEQRHALADANGNITDYVDSFGTLKAHYEFDGFGNTTKTSGETLPFGYSSKYHDSETGLNYYGYRYFSPLFGKWLNRDPLGEQGGDNVYAFVKNQGTKYVDYLGLALYVFDGTGNDMFNDRGYLERNNLLRRRDQVATGGPSNPALLFRMYQGPNKAYAAGVGTRWEGIAGLAFGLGGAERMGSMMEHFEEFYQDGKGDCIVDLTGYSRGAASARAFANRIRSRHPAAIIRWMGLFDTVASTGLPGNGINLGYDLTIPENTGRVIHIVAAQSIYGGEHRANFPSDSIFVTGMPPPGTRHSELFIHGSHGDIGGAGNLWNVDLEREWEHYSARTHIADYTLRAVRDDGVRHGVPFGPIPRPFQYDVDSDSERWRPRPTGNYNGAGFTPGFYNELDGVRDAFGSTGIPLPHGWAQNLESHQWSYHR